MGNVVIRASGAEVSALCQKASDVDKTMDSAMDDESVSPDNHRWVEFQLYQERVAPFLKTFSNIKGFPQNLADYRALTNACQSANFSGENVTLKFSSKK